MNEESLPRPHGRLTSHDLSTMPPSSSSSSPPSFPTAPPASPPTSSPLLLLLKTPSPSPSHDKYTLALSPHPSGSAPAPPPPLYIPVLSHILRPDPLINLLLTHLPAAPSSSSSSSSSPLPTASSSPSSSFPYGALILTSQRAAAALNAALSAPAVASKLGGGGGAEKLRAGLGRVTIYTVGPATEAAVREVCANHGLDDGDGTGVGSVEVKGGEEAGSGEVLARGMLGAEGAGLRYEGVFDDDDDEQEGEGHGDGQGVDVCGGGGGEVRGSGLKVVAGKRRRRKRRKPVLFLAGETRRDVIPRMLQSLDLPEEERIKVDEMTVYESSELQSFAFEYAGALAQTDAVDGPRWTVVFSPMAGRGMLNGLGWLDEETMKVDKRKMEGRRDYVCCIGPTTRAYLSKEFGLEADVVAEKPSPEGVRQGIGRFVAESDK